MAVSFGVAFDEPERRENIMKTNSRDAIECICTNPHLKVKGKCSRLSIFEFTSFSNGFHLAMETLFGIRILVDSFLAMRTMSPHENRF